MSGSAGGSSAGKGRDHAMEAAEGWLLLGCPDEAARELASVVGETRRDARYFDLSWQVGAAAGDWATALRAAEAWVVHEGEREVGPWIQRSYALRRVPGGGLAAALEGLAPALERFPCEPIVPYNLACYLAQSGRTAEAWEMLQEAVRRGGAELMVPMARADPDLIPLSDRIAAAWPEG